MSKRRRTLVHYRGCSGVDLEWRTNLRFWDLVGFEQAAGYLGRNNFRNRPCALGVPPLGCSHSACCRAVRWEPLMRTHSRLAIVQLSWILLAVAAGACPEAGFRQGSEHEKDGTQHHVL